jgi:hypothetical protein
MNDALKMSLFDFLIRNRSEVLRLTFEHLLLVLLAPAPPRLSEYLSELC